MGVQISVWAVLRGLMACGGDDTRGGGGGGGGNALHMYITIKNEKNLSLFMQKNCEED